MNELDAAKLLMIVQQIYPNFKVTANPKAQTRAWAMILRDMTFEQAEASLMAFAAADNKGFPPAPGQIRAKAELLQGKGEELTDVEAWQMVFKALRNGYYGAEQEFAKLPAEIQSVLGSPQTLRDWSMQDVSVCQTVTASNFQRSYRARVGRMQEYKSIPLALREYGEGLFLEMPEAPRQLTEPEANHLRNERMKMLSEWKGGDT